jgi:serine/threonine-protein kinase
MGEIFLARLEGAAGFEKLFVIKRILPHLAGDARFRAMLIGEARIASMMTHANVCQVYELGETDGQLYIVMEYLEGSTMLPLLRKLSKEGAALDLGFIGGVLQQAADGLHYAHELKDRSGEYLGIVHRDVSPSNVFLTDSGVVKVLDFGIAKVKNASSQTQTGTVKGKYAYMAPEQLRGYAVDRRADVFALGVVVYEMLALRRLFQRKTDYLTFRAVMEQPINNIRHYRPDCPEALANAVSCALERDPDNRFATARQFGTAVLDAIGVHRRPWTQGEISDFVNAHFADEIRQRSLQITSAVHSGTRKSMPLIAMPDEETELEDNAPDFAPVDSEISETPVDIRHLRGPSEEHTAVHDPPASPPPLDTLRGVPASTQQQLSASQQQPVLVISPRRSLMWPIVAFAMVAVSGGALFLVWQQMQTRSPATVFIETGRAGSAPNEYIVEGDNASADGETDPGERVASSDRATPPAPVADEAAKAASTETVAKQPPPPRSPDNGRRDRKSPPEGVAVDPKLSRAVLEYVDSHRDNLTACVTRHGKVRQGSKLALTIGPDGRLTTITITPADVDSSAVGTCIKRVFKAGTVFDTGAYPHGNLVFSIALTQPV